MKGSKLEESEVGRKVSVEVILVFILACFHIVAVDPNVPVLGHFYTSVSF